MPPRGAFTVRGGWYFLRGSDASVTVWCEDGGEVTFDAGTWASIVASVSQHGEGDAPWRCAFGFHGTGPACLP